MADMMPPPTSSCPMCGMPIPQQMPSAPHPPGSCPMCGQ